MGVPQVLRLRGSCICEPALFASPSASANPGAEKKPEPQPAWWRASPPLVGWQRLPALRLVAENLPASLSKRYPSVKYTPLWYAAVQIREDLKRLDQLQWWNARHGSLREQRRDTNLSTGVLPYLLAG